MRAGAGGRAELVDGCHHKADLKKRRRLSTGSKKVPSVIPVAQNILLLILCSYYISHSPTLPIVDREQEQLLIYLHSLARSDRRSCRKYSTLHERMRRSKKRRSRRSISSPFFRRPSFRLCSSSRQQVTEKSFLPPALDPSLQTFS